MTPSRPPPPSGAAAWKPEQLELARRVRPLAEAMYLVLASDAEIDERERDVLRGALRTLTDGALSSSVLETMLQEFDAARAQEGTEQRLDAVASALYLDPMDAELAVSLVSAAAEVDGRLDAREQTVVKALAERLGVSAARVDELWTEPE